MGDLGQAADLLRHNVEALTPGTGQDLAIPSRAWLASVLGRRGEFRDQQAETAYRDALALAEPCGMRPLVAHCHRGLGTVYRHTGRREQAQEHLTTATTMYHEMDMTYWLEKANREIEELESDD